MVIPVRSFQYHLFRHELQRTECSGQLKDMVDVSWPALKGSDQCEEWGVKQRWIIQQILVSDPGGCWSFEL
jgi:hypothetical protein